MKARLILLNLILLGCIGAIAWQGRIRWQEAQAQRRSALDSKLPRQSPPPVSPVPRPEVPQAVKYVDVATKDLFSKDRNPNVIIEAPKVVVEKPREMPSLPIIYGVLGLPGGTRALMSEKPGLSSKSVRIGDSVGEFKIAALDTRSVTFIWNGKEVQRQIDDLMDRSGGRAAAAPPPGPAPMQALQVGVPPPQNQPNAPPQQNVIAGGVIGADIGAEGRPERACRPGDQSPAGTVMEGFRKVLISTPFGTNCRWVPVP